MVAWHEMPGNARSRIRPGGYGMIWLRGPFDYLGCERNLAPPITPFPTGRIMFAGFPGISCQATIIRSLRDKQDPRTTKSISPAYVGAHAKAFSPFLGGHGDPRSDGAQSPDTEIR